MTAARRLPALAAAALIACSTTDVKTPTRSLDRPSDVALVCASVKTTPEGEQTIVRPLSECHPDFVDPEGTTNGQLIALVANTGRGEIAVVATEALSLGPLTSVGRPLMTSGATILDLDTGAPGYGFLPVGSLPERLRATADGCRAVTVNVDGCDLGVIDVPRLLRARTGEDETPVPIVRQVRPRLPSGEEILARPTWVEIVPSSSCLGRETCDRLEDAGAPHARAFVAFPGCALVAEVDLSTGDVLQAVSFTVDGAQPIEPSAVRCPAECARQAGGSSPSPVDAAAPSDDASTMGDGGTGDGGVPPLVPATSAAPRTLAILSAASLDDLCQPLPADLRLYVGDATGSQVTRLRLDDAGRLGDPGRIPLENPWGVEALRLSPLIPELQDPSVADHPGTRYLYAIARDQTVRVVATDLERECETNPDELELEAAEGGRYALFDGDGNALRAPSEVRGLLRCLPVGAVGRSGMARSPGFSPAGGGLPRDVAVVRVDGKTLPTDNPPYAAPTVLSGVFAWVIDSAGRASALNIVDDCPQPNDPKFTGVACAPEAWAPTAAEARGNVGAPTPRVIEILPHRTRNGNGRFATPRTVDNSGTPRLAGLPTVVSSDLGSVSLCNVADDRTGCTSAPTDVAKARGMLTVREVTRSLNESWNLVWEGVVGRSTVGGRFRRDGQTALMSDPAVAFCARGTEVGDKVLLVGCDADTDCRRDQYCFHDPGAPTAAMGLCLTRQADDQATAEVEALCAPWSQAQRLYRVVEARDGEVRVDEISEPEHGVDRVACQRGSSDCAGLSYHGQPLTCLDDDMDGQGTRGQCLLACDPERLGTCGAGFVCARSRRGDLRCLRARLPDEATQATCFTHLQRFEILAGEAFVTAGDTSGSFASGQVDRATGRCAPPTSGTVSPLRRGRIPLAPPPCPAEVAADWTARLTPGTTCLLSPDPADVPEGLAPDHSRFLRFAGPIFDTVVVVRGARADDASRWRLPPPDDTHLAFTLTGGFRPLAYGLGTDTTAQLPRAALVAPDRHTLYVVDEGKQTAATGLRGQLIRFLVDPASQSSDTSFVIK